MSFYMLQESFILFIGPMLTNNGLKMLGHGICQMISGHNRWQHCYGFWILVTGDMPLGMRDLMLYAGQLRHWDYTA